MPEQNVVEAVVQDVVDTEEVFTSGSNSPSPVDDDRDPDYVLPVAVRNPDAIHFISDEMVAVMDSSTNSEGIFKKSHIKF